MDEKYKQYENYSWDDDQQWLTYFGQLCPKSAAGLTATQQEKFRRKWYKRNKDPDFQIDYKPLPEAAKPKAKPAPKVYQDQKSYKTPPKRQYQQHP